MTKEDIDEIFEFQLFRYRFGIFLTGVINFFLPPFWRVRTDMGSVDFTTWEWTEGFALAFLGQPFATQDASLAMGASLALGILAAVLAWRPRYRWTLASLVCGAAASVLALTQVSRASKIGEQNIRGIFESSLGFGAWLILACFVLATLISLYPFVFGRSEGTFFEDRNDKHRTVDLRWTPEFGPGDRL